MTDASARRPLAPVLGGQPRWVLPALVIILLTALTLYSWRLGSSGLSTYYASSAKSMADNWRAFSFGSLDPGSTWTLDKLSGFLVPEALAIRMFGFHPWVLDLPQVIEGLVTVLVSYLVGARWRGPSFGLAVAGIMTVTPLLAAMFGHPTEDAMLTMSMVLAFAAWQRCILSGRWIWMFPAAVWVAIGFQAKMMQAWLIVPALLIGFVVASPGSTRTRLVKAAVVGVVTVGLSISWIGAIQLVPPADRPYVDGTTNNNAFSMVFAYNGVDRLLPGVIPGAVPQLASHTVTPGRGTATQSTGHLLLKMLLPGITTQIGWLYPSAALGALLAARAALRRRRDGVRGPPGDGVMAGTAVLWLGTTGVVLSLAFVPHATYFGVIVLPLTLLATAGITGAISTFHRDDGSTWLLPILTTAQMLWTASIVALGPPATAWIAAPILGVGVVGLLALLVAARGAAQASPRRRTLAVTIAVCAIMLAPVVWSTFVLGLGGAGSASDAYAGPRAGASPTAARLNRPSASPTAVSTVTADAELLRYVDTHGAGYYRFATDTLAIAVSVNLDTGAEVIPLGGFSRQAPWLSSSALSKLVTADRLRFVLLSAPDPSAPANPVLDATRNWVDLHCASVLHGEFRAGSRAVQTLFDCRV